jgi:hypothetical protein
MANNISFVFTSPGTGSVIDAGALTIQYTVKNDSESDISGTVTLESGSSSAGVIPASRKTKSVEVSANDSFDGGIVTTVTPGTYKVMGSISVGGKIQSYDEVTFEVKLDVQPAPSGSDGSGSDQSAE